MPLALAALSWAAWNTRIILQQIIHQSEGFFLISAIGLWLIVHFCIPIFTVLIFRASRQTISYQAAFLIHAKRLPAKYLPGGIWHSVARATDYHEQGIGGKQITLYLLIENLIAAAVTLLLGGSIVAGLVITQVEWRWAASLLAVSGLITLLFLPRITNHHLFNCQEKLILKFYWAGIFCATFNWIMIGVAFTLYLSSFRTLDLSTSLLQSAGIYIFSWGIGFITLFAPQGIGITEYTSAQLLNTAHSVGTLTVLLAGFRAVILCADLLAWIFSNLTSKIISLKRPLANTHSAQQ